MKRGPLPSVRAAVGPASLSQRFGLPADNNMPGNPYARFLRCAVLEKFYGEAGHHTSFQSRFNALIDALREKRQASTSEILPEPSGGSDELFSASFLTI